MRRVGRAELAGDVGRPGAGDEGELLLLVGEVDDRERHRGGGQVGDHIDARIVPLPGDARGHVGLVLPARRDDLDRPAEHAAARILDRHPHGLDGAEAADIRVGAFEVDEDPDADRIVGGPARGETGDTRPPPPHPPGPSPGPRSLPCHVRLLPGAQWRPAASSPSGRSVDQPVSVPGSKRRRTRSARRTRPRRGRGRAARSGYRSRGGGAGRRRGPARRPAGSSAGWCGPGPRSGAHPCR